MSQSLKLLSFFDYFCLLSGTVSFRGVRVVGAYDLTNHVEVLNVMRKSGATLTETEMQRHE